MYSMSGDGESGTFGGTTNPVVSSCWSSPSISHGSYIVEDSIKVKLLARASDRSVDPVLLSWLVNMMQDQSIKIVFGLSVCITLMHRFETENRRTWRDKKVP
jgi:hypothetical protein